MRARWPTARLLTSSDSPSIWRDGAKIKKHAHDGMVVPRKSPAFLNFQDFEQPQGHRRGARPS
jgi:hypothetical protein